MCGCGVVGSFDKLFRKEAPTYFFSCGILPWKTFGETSVVPNIGEAFGTIIGTPYSTYPKVFSFTPHFTPHEPKPKIPDLLILWSSTQSVIISDGLLLTRNGWMRFYNVLYSIYTRYVSTSNEKPDSWTRVMRCHWSTQELSSF